MEILLTMDDWFNWSDTQLDSISHHVKYALDKAMQLDSTLDEDYCLQYYTVVYTYDTICFTFKKESV